MGNSPPLFQILINIFYNPVAYIVLPNCGKKSESVSCSVMSNSMQPCGL